MSVGPLSAAVAHLGHAVRPPDPRPDAALVGAFVRDRDEAAAAELVRRHGPMVYGVCRRLHATEADDAFQAVWLVFSRNAGRVRPPGAVGAWLHGVAVKVATKARTQSFTRRRRLMAAARPDHTDPTPADPLLTAVLDEELARLPEKLRRAVLLCDLGGKTRVEAAAELGWPEGTVATRLAQGRERLAARLRRRGVVLPAVGLAAVLAPEATAAPVPAALGLAAVRVVLGTAAAPPAALPLADAAGTTMYPATWKLATLGVLAAVGLTVGGVTLGPPADPAKPPDPAVGAEWELVATLKDHGQLVYSAAFAPDGKTFATVAGDRVIVWDTATLKPLRRFPIPWPGPAEPLREPVDLPPPHQFPVRTVGHTDERFGPQPPWRTLRYLPDGMLAVVGTARPFDWSYSLLDPNTGVAIDPVARGTRAFGPVMLGNKGDRLGVLCVPRDPAGKAFTLLEDRSGTDGPNGNRRRFLPDRPCLVTLRPDGKRAAVAEWVREAAGRPGVGSIAVCDIATGKTLRELTGIPDGALAVAWSPDGKLIAAGGRDELCVWDATSGTRAFEYKPADTTVTAVRFSTDGRQLVAGLTNRTTGRSGAVAFTVGDYTTVRPLPGHTTEGVSDLAVSPDGGTLVATVGDWTNPAGNPAARAKNGEVRVFRQAGRPPVPAKADPPRPADEAERNQDLWVWQGRRVPDEEGGSLPRSVAFTPDGKFLVTGGRKRSVQFWTLSTTPLRSNELGLAPSPADDASTAAAVAPNGKTVAYTRPNGTTVQDADPGCWLLGPPRGQPLPPDWQANRPAPAAPPADRVFELVPSPDHPPTAVAFSPDGTRLAMTDGRKLSVRDIGRPGEVAFGPVARSTAGPSAVSWAPDGKRLVFLPNVRIADTFIAQVWGAGSGEPMAMLAHGTARLTGAVWAADGKRIVTADEAGEVVVWDAVTFKERKRLKADGPVTALAMRADGRRFAAGVQAATGPTVRVWTVQEGSDPDNWLGSSTLPLPAAAAVTGLAFSPDGKVLAAGTDAGLAVWDRVKLAPKE